MALLLPSLLLLLAFGGTERIKSNEQLEYGTNLTRGDIYRKHLLGKSHSKVSGSVFLTKEEKKSQPENGTKSDESKTKESKSVGLRNECIVCEDDGGLLAMISEIFWWCSLMFWSLSFYPQLCMNCAYRSVAGLSFDYVMYNVFGFSLYVMFNALVLFVPEVRNHYRSRSPTKTLPVGFGDLLFSGHALSALIVTMVHFFFYDRGNQTIYAHTLPSVVYGLVMSLCFVFAATQKHLAWMQVVYLISTLQLCVTFVKYVHQVRLNYQRKSTIGLSIVGVQLEFLGACLCNMQILVASFTYANSDPFTENPLKFGAGLISMIFAVIFLYQRLFYNAKPQYNKWKISIFKHKGAILKIRRSTGLGNKQKSAEMNIASENDGMLHGNSKIGENEENGDAVPHVSVV